ncbi:hypothetical protein [Kitasatospora phosalacinea]|uniref:Uncharacterized protein n=1 Tax=Kitasatospora phosalacinea TaxID=2065 RepID=A0A9W6PCB2_9ACTN|nr:hypothetical protein [Kitasatospora phosalacinea]GLW52384.1 hypothetical protein Kpho01_03950 [Kitasatospora phosalacinea]
MSWATLLDRKRVLAVVHTVVYGQRLREVCELLAADLRVQVVFTVAPHAFNEGVAAFLMGLGGTVVPWEQAVETEFDLVLAAGSRGIERVRGPLVRLPHGAGHLKLARALPPAGSVTGRRDGPGSGSGGGSNNGSNGGGAREVSGLGRDYLLWEGRPNAAAYALAHRDDLAVLERTCPEVLPVAEVVGDGDHDRIVAALPRRAEYRAALGLEERERLVLLCSTWGPDSVFGGLDALLPRLVRELPAGRFRTALVVHPNVTAGHGGWQVRRWVEGVSGGAVSLVTPQGDWRPLLVAADYVIGDHGSVTLYAALTGARILLARFPHRNVNPLSPGVQLARTAPALDPAHPLAEQLAYADGVYRPEAYAEIGARISSEPGAFLPRIRRLLYRVLELGEPARPAAEPPLALPAPLLGGGRWR